LESLYSIPLAHDSTASTSYVQQPIQRPDCTCDKSYSPDCTTCDKYKMQHDEARAESFNKGKRIQYLYLENEVAQQNRRYDPGRGSLR
jgi:hypothetical protein